MLSSEWRGAGSGERGALASARPPDSPGPVAARWRRASRRLPCPRPPPPPPLRPPQSEMNVPRSHRAARPRVLLPPGESAPREDRDLHRPRRPLPPATGVPPVEPGRPMRELCRRHAFRPRAQTRAPSRVKRRLLEQAVRKGADVQTGPAHYHGLPAVGLDLVQPLGGVSGEAAGAVALTGPAQV